jgi:hypothetical protein
VLHRRVSLDDVEPDRVITLEGTQQNPSWHTSTTNATGGTSVASTQVAGAAEQANPTASPAHVAKALTDKATTGVVSNAGSGSPNRLPFTAPASTPTPPTGCVAYSGNDFDLYLEQRRISSAWAYRRRRVCSYSGAGAYTLEVTSP